MEQTKWPQNRPNGHKIYQHFPFQGPPKSTHIVNFGKKLCNLATLVHQTVLYFSTSASLGDFDCRREK
jgi:hypothetical protein